MCMLCDGKMKIVYVFLCKVLFMNSSGDLHYLKYHLNICAQRSCLCFRKVRLHQADANKCNRLFVTVIKKEKKNYTQLYSFYLSWMCIRMYHHAETSSFDLSGSVHWQKGGRGLGVTVI